MKKSFSFLIFLMVFIGLPAAALSQVVTVRDKDTREPLEWVTLSSQDPRATVTTDKEGRADISAFRGASKIAIRRIGYLPAEVTWAELESRAFEWSLQASATDAREVVVSAMRWRQASSEVPSRVLTVSLAETALENPQTTADLLGLTGQVFIQKSQQAGGSPVIRGFATNRLLYTIDGVRMNTAIFRSGNIQNVISLDPFALERSEVLFGPASVVYGSDAIGGIMSFQTWTPRFSLSREPVVEGEATARYAFANNERTGHVHVNVGWETWAFVTSFSSFDFDHLRQGSHGPKDYIKPFYVERQDGVDRVITQDDPLLQVPSSYSQLNVMQKVRFRPNDAWDIQYGFHYSETSSYGRYDRHCRLRDGLPRYAEWSYGPQKWMMNNLSVTNSRRSFLADEWTIRLAQQSFEESRIDRNRDDATRHVRIEDVEALSANLDIRKALGTRHELFYGLEYVTNDVDSTGIDEDIVTGESGPGPARYPQATWRSAAAYLTDQFRISDRILLQAGLRYNRYMLDAVFDTTFYPFPFTTASLDKGSLVGTFGLVVHPAASWALRAGAATAFRSPNVDDMGKVFDSAPGSVVVPNPGLKAEYATSFDLGVAKAFGKTLRVDISGYYTSLDNAMVRRDFTLNGQEYIMYDGELSRVQAIQNAAIARVYGIQAGLEVQLPYGFRFSTDLNVQDGEEELDDGSLSPSRHAGPWFGFSRLSYVTGRLHLQLTVAYQGLRRHEDLAEEERAKTEIYALDEEGNTYAPAWCLLNLKALIRLSDRWTLSAGVENLTDQRYRPYSSGISGAGRSFVLAASTSF